MECWAKMGKKNLDLSKCQCNVFKVTSNDGDRIIVNNFGTLRTTLRKYFFLLMPLCIDAYSPCLGLTKFDVPPVYISNSSFYCKNSFE